MAESLSWDDGLHLAVEMIRTQHRGLRDTDRVAMLADTARDTGVTEDGGYRVLAYTSAQVAHLIAVRLAIETGTTVLEVLDLVERDILVGQQPPPD